MSTVTTSPALEFLKADLGFYAPDATMTAYLEHLLDAARNEIADKGIVLAETEADDLDLLVMYAAWMYRKRDGSGAIPDMLRYRLNNRIVRTATTGAAT